MEHTALPEPVKAAPADLVCSGTRDYDFFTELDEKLAQLAAGGNVHLDEHSNS
jgi:hypothetical protein